MATNCNESLTFFGPNYPHSQQIEHGSVPNCHVRNVLGWRWRGGTISLGGWQQLVRALLRWWTSEPCEQWMRWLWLHGNPGPAHQQTVVCCLLDNCYARPNVTSRQHAVAHNAPQETGPQVRLWMWPWFGQAVRIMFHTSCCTVKEFSSSFIVCFIQINNFRDYSRRCLTSSGVRVRGSGRDRSGGNGQTIRTQGEPQLRQIFSHNIHW